MSTSGPLTRYSDEEVELATAVVSALPIYPIYSGIERPVEGGVRDALHLDRGVVQGYVAHLQAIGVSPDTVRAYLQVERRVLASLYLLARQQIPSLTELRRLAYRYVLDARTPACEAFYTYEFRPRGDGRWEYCNSPVTESRADPGLPVPVRMLTLHFVDPLLWAVGRTPPDCYAIVENLDLWFRGVPSPADTLEGLALGLEYDDLPDGNVGLWIGDRRVAGLDTERQQKLLLYLCEHPESREAGRALERRLDITNVAALVKEVQSRFAAVVPEAGAWLMNGPVRWAPGIRPVRRDRGKPRV
jgi:hypothetical protein